jgi:hypothetical protein
MDVLASLAVPDGPVPSDSVVQQSRLRAPRP